MSDFSKAYESFGRWAANESRDPWMGDLDGYKIQAKLHELGILVKEPFSREKHRDRVLDWEEFNEGDDVYLFADGATP